MRYPWTGRAAALLLALSATLSGCGDHTPHSKSPQPDPSPSSPVGVEPVSLTFGVFGSKQVLSAYRRIVDSYRTVDPTVHITLRSWPDESAMTTDLRRSGGEVPDVFLTSGADLQPLIDGKVIRPVDTYLDARNVDLGDGYSRQALESFSVDRHLQCMPYSVSPDVVYYNSDLVNFAAMKARGLSVPDDPTTGTWSLDQFQTAVRFASKPRQGIKGIYVDPTIRGLAPWIVAAGGKVFDDDASPTRLALADSMSSLQSILPTLADPRLRLWTPQLGRTTPLQWFERGKLAMMVGDRSLVPELRKQPGLHWDVMAMPTSGSDATIGDYSGLCLSGSTNNADVAADFLTYLITEEAVAQMSRTGYVVPVNQEVAYTGAFAQPGRPPQNAGVFLSAVKGLQTLPDRDLVDRVQQVVGSKLEQLVTPPGVLRLPALTQRIDDVSIAPLTPPPSASGSPSESPAASPTG